MRGARLASAILASLVILAVSAPTVAAASTKPNVGAPPPYKIYVVDNIYGHYDGYYDTNTGRGCTGPCTLTATETFTWSNSWGASITFTKAPIQAQVSFNVSASSSTSYSYSFPVPARQTKVIHYKDWYHVTQMHVHTATCYSGAGCSGYVYGTAWAAQWYQRIYYVVNV